MKKRKGVEPPPPEEPGQGDLFGTSLLQPLRPAPPAAKASGEKAPPALPGVPPRAELPPPSVPPVSVPRPERTVLTVGELTRQIKQTVESRFPRVLVRGEVSSFRGANARGHWYFTLKDADASIDAKVWASMAGRIRFALRDGMEVLAEGSVDLYEPQGRYSLIVSRLEPVGEGALALAFEQLKQRLAAEGLIGDRRVRAPRPVPFLPRRIGVVTSRTGAALQDFLRVLHSRNPRLGVLLADARVQGEGAAEDVARAIERLGRTDVDVIVVTRGGGSVEDLWTFNEERVARAIFASPVPVVSAIGHEIDFTIADFVADLRAATPSAAAERLSPVLADLELTLATQSGRLRRAMERRVLELREYQGQLAARLTDPRRAVNQQRLHLSEQVEAMMRVLRPQAREHRERLRALQERLQRARPQTRLGEQRSHLLKLAMRLSEAARAGVSRRRGALADGRLGLERVSPTARVAAERARLAAARSRLLELQRGALASSQTHFGRLGGRLDALSPLKVMSRGYAVTFRQKDGVVVRSTADVAVGDVLGIKLSAHGAKTLGGCEEIEATVTGLKGPVDC
ncbi:exodeoxyribonuclease VII large subunit [Corallococcus sicarius]|uniref:Exodeoxyribonuclease 7 large subunit n=1 Tax=Corallococcus sicarius TaxID=2316726 RepID=A0A3A8NDK7_9BACT|nr:exodeoxyribonuclease VII large subunit [Corallococcus sicarius]RKH42338.1 exodeoxyribonuclease VII large subunit [Corallococcus sicarius]